MTAQQCIRAARLLEQHALYLVSSHTHAGRWIGEYGKQSKREHDDCRELANALSAMVARYHATRPGIE